jgi:hypothetical protein
MKRALASVIAAGICTAALSTVSFAGPNAGANIELHVLGLTTKAACTRQGLTPNQQTMPACENIIGEGNVGTYYFLHVLVTDGDAAAGVAGMQFGIQYGSGMSDAVGIDIFGWTLCATLEFPQPAPVWPNNGGGTLITWDSTNRCQQFEPGGAGTGVTGNAGYFYMAAYTPATFQITVRPVDNAAKVASCAAEEDILEPTDLGSAAFGGGTGYSPCAFVVPTIQTTWSTVKSLYTN